ncbi:MAG: type IX secretion system sortase PorU [Chitinophagales bacterium]
MYKVLFLFFSLLGFSYAQQVSELINWNLQTYNPNTKSYQQSFKEAAIDNNSVPFITKTYSINGNNANVSFNDLQFEKFNNQNIDKTGLKSNIFFKTDVVSIKKENYASVSFCPLRINPITGEIEKLVSYSVDVQSNYTNQPKGAKSTKPNSILASGSWYKINVANDGIYKIDHEFLTTNNITNGNINFNSFGVFGQAMGLLPEANSAFKVDDIEEIQLKIKDQNNNGVWEQGDYVLFYAKGPNIWQYQNSTYNYTANYFTEKAGYFITTNRGSGGFMPTQQSISSTSFTANTYDFLGVFEEEINNVIYTELPATMGSGREWFGTKLNNYNNTQTATINIPNINSSTNANISIRVLAHSSSNQSKFTINNNGAFWDDVYTNAVGSGNYPDAAKDALKNYSKNLSSTNNFEIVFSSSDQQATGFLDYIKVIAKANINLAGDQLLFRNADALGQNTQYNISNANNATEIWDVTRGTAIKKINGTLSGSTYAIKVSMDTLREFVAVNTASSNFSTPNFEGNVSNQNLHALDQQDLFIITNNDFLSEANRLANFHRDNGLTVAVVDVQKIFNEFSSGEQDITAIRNFFKMFYDRATNQQDMPKYALFFGDASFDYKDKLGKGQNIVPTYESYNSFSQIESYCTDDYFGYLDDSEGENIEVANNSNRLDIAIGRLPIDDINQAKGVVDKIINYNTANTMKDWRNNLCFVADDEDNNLHFNQVEQLTALTSIEDKDYYNFDKIYLDAYTQENAAGGDRYPSVNDAILRKIKTGAFLINYTGHGGPKNWSQERVFNIEDIRALDNIDNLPLFITATCDFSSYDDVDFHSAGESLITNEKGGAIALFTTTRVVYAYENFLMNSEILDFLFQDINGRKPTLGEIIMQAKNTAAQSTNNRKFVLLGDPALTLAYPKYDVITTKVNSVPVNVQLDTLKALERVKIEGEVHNLGGNLLSNFNGVIYPTVFDKIGEYQTKGQDVGNGGSQVANFELRNKILFKGKASVSGGKFAFEFIVPKDINYAFDKGKITYYAHNTGATTDAHGYTYDFYVGGTSDTILADDKGPIVDVYINDTTFAFGGLTDEKPTLLVKLEDISGINTVGNGVGHDIVGLLNENTQEQYLLNEFYEATLDDFTKGNVEYPFNKLDDGRYSVRVKAWDVHNNPGEGYTEFVVASSAELALKNVFNYPNPFTTHTSFIFQHNRPGEMLDVNVQIYTISGKVIKNINQTVMSEGYNVNPNEITWNGLDDYGDLIGKGVYIYKVKVKGENGFSAQEFQKLVILR